MLDTSPTSLPGLRAAAEHLAGMNEAASPNLRDSSCSRCWNCRYSPARGIVTMADTTNPPPSSYGPALFADWSKVKIDSPSSAPRDSVRYMTWELGVLLEAEPHYRAKGKACDCDSMKRGIEDLQLRIAAKRAGVDPNSPSPEARARVRWKIPARKRVVY